MMSTTRSLEDLVIEIDFVDDINSPRYLRKVSKIVSFLSNSPPIMVTQAISANAVEAMAAKFF